MNNLNLLFDYRGAISAKQFKRGIYIVSVICGLLIIFHLFKTFDYYIIASNKWSIEQTFIETLFRSFIPSFIHFGFILFYCSLVLTVKRGRTLGLSYLKKITFSLLIYLFFMGLYVITTSIFSVIKTLHQEGNYIRETEPSNEIIPLLYILFIIITCFTIIGCFIIVSLSSNKKEESENDLPPISNINHRKSASLFILMLLIEMTYCANISILGPHLSIIEQIILKECRNIIIYILATCLAFRVIVPNTKEENTSFSLFDNQIIRLLFDWRGSISKREFWCGIIIIYACMLYLIDGNVWQMLDSLLVSNTYEGEGFTQSTTLLYLLHQFVPSFFPYECIIFYSSILISIKRCRAFHYNILGGYTLGISLYLTIASICASINLSKETEENNIYFYLIIGCGILFIIGSLISTIGIIVLSQRSRYEGNTSQALDNPIQYILNNGWLILFWTIATFITTQLHDLLGDDLYLTAIIMIYIIYLTVFLFLSMDRIQNAGLNKNWVIIGIIIFLTAEATYYVLHECRFFIDSPKAYALGQLTTSFITSVIIAFSFLLFLLPSKYKK